MIRHLTDKMQTARDVREWLLQVHDDHAGDEPDEDIVYLLFVINAFIVDCERVQNKKKLDELAYYHVRNCQTLACILLEEHMTEYSDALASWTYASTPETAIELIAHVLNDVVDHFASSLLSGRAKNFTPLSDDDIFGIYTLLAPARATATAPLPKETR